jgi:hypothetical protein
VKQKDKRMRRLAGLANAGSEKSGADRSRKKDLNVKRSTPDIALNESAATAFLYAYRGWAILPLYGIRNGGCRCPEGKKCTEPGSHPRMKRGLKAATTDLITIKHWWNRWPSANIGIATGKISGIIVITVEPRNGGNESLQAAKKKLGALPITLKANTGGNGRHRIFQHPKTAVRTDTCGKLLGRGVDVLSDGSYFVAPGSLDVSGKKYSWVKGKSIRDVTPATLANSWLERLCSGHDRIAGSLAAAAN